MLKEAKVTGCNGSTSSRFIFSPQTVCPCSQEALDKTTTSCGAAAEPELKLEMKVNVLRYRVV